MIHSSKQSLVNAVEAPTMRGEQCPVSRVTGNLMGTGSSSFSFSERLLKTMNQEKHGGEAVTAARQECEMPPLTPKEIASGHFATTGLISPVASLTVAAPHSGGLPFASNLQPNVPAFFAAHCASFRFTKYQPEPTGFCASLPWV